MWWSWCPVLVPAAGVGTLKNMQQLKTALAKSVNFGNSLVQSSEQLLSGRNWFSWKLGAVEISFSVTITKLGAIEISFSIIITIIMSNEPTR